MSPTTIHPPPVYHGDRQRHDQPEEAEQVELLACLVAMAGCDDLETAAQTLSSRLPTTLKRTHLAVATLQHGRLSRLLAVTGMLRLDRRAGQVRAIEAALDEAVVHGDLLTYQQGQQTERPLRTHAHLTRLVGCRWIVSSPLTDGHSHTVGAWLLWGESRHQMATACRWLRISQGPVAATLDVLSRASEGLAGRMVRTWHHRWSLHRRPIVAMLLLATVILALLPIRYRIRCECQIEPVVRRYVAAPFNATLAHTQVEPGDVVSENQLLAKLDGREIRWELAALEADYQQAKQGRDAAMADRKTAAAQLARLEMQQLEQRIALMHDRQEHLEVRSPVAGVVVSGDLQRVEGAPLTIGQTMFEIAPLERVIVEVAVPEREITYVTPGDEATVRLDAFPGKHWQGTLLKIHPQAQLRDSQQVFLAEVQLPNTTGNLRPGMRGQTKVAGPRAPLSWILFHRPWEAAVRWLGW